MPAVGSVRFMVVGIAERAFGAATTWAASAHMARPEVEADAQKDAALLAALSQNHPSAQKALWDRFYPLVSRTLRRTFGPQDEVADLVQDVFFHLFRKLPTLRDPSALRSFVYSITTRVALKELRRRRLHRWLELSPSGTLPETASAPRDIGAEAALRRLYAILDELAPRDRTLFVLRNLEDMTLPELAQTTGVSLATVKRRLRVAGDHVAQRASADALLAAYLTAATPFLRAQEAEGTHTPAAAPSERSQDGGRGKAGT